MTVHRDKFLQQNKLGALIPQIYFWNKNLQVSNSSSVHHQEFFTVYTAIHAGLLTACSQAVSITRMTHTNAVCTVKAPDGEQRNCPKHVDFYSKNKFQKLVHLVRFIVIIAFCSLLLL